MRSLKFTLSVACVAFLCAAVSCRRSTSEDQVRQLSEQLVYETLALSPSAATSQGYHQHHGVILDEQLDDYSPSAIGRAIDLFNRSLESANRIREAGVTPELAADLEVIKLACQSQLLDLKEIQSYRHNPTIYVETIGNALYSPFILGYAPESKRLTQSTARIEKIPAFLDTARQNLIDSPEIWNQVAQQENQGNLELIDHTIRARVPAALRPRFDPAAANAIAALRSFSDFLKTNLSRHPGDWRLGPRLYAEKFRLTLATGDTPAQTLADARATLENMREDMRKQAATLYPKFFPGQTPPGDLNTLVSQVLDKIARQHAAPADYFSDARRDLAEAEKFVRDHHLLALPKNNLQVIPTPEFMRGIYAVGGFSPAPALQPQLGAYYWITPFTSDMTAGQVESKLREYNFWGLKILTIHEAMPGHYVQFEYADRLQPSWRRALRTIFANGPYVEGWAVFATEFMIDAGYDATPEMRLTFEKQMLRVVSNTILDIQLQTMGMTDREALDLMIEDTFQEQEEARKKLQRAKLSSCQLPTYFVGWRGWDRLRDRYEKKQGSAFSPSEFNERALQQGAIPLPTLNRILLP